MFTVEFYGGPFDGHQRRYSKRPNSLPVDIVWLVCDDAFQQLSGSPSDHHGQLTSVALYELHISETSLTYRFKGAISATDFKDSLVRSQGSF